MAINLHHKPEAITGHFGDGRHFGVRIDYSYEDSILGTAGAAKRLESLFLDGAFLVVYGDVLTDMDLTSLVRFHRLKRGVVTVGLYRVENPWACGLVGLDEDGRITDFVEKPPPEEVFTDLANAGVFVVEPTALSYIPPDTFYDFGHHLFPDLLRRGIALYGCPLSDTEYLIDIGTPEKYEQALREWRSVPERAMTASQGIRAQTWE